MGITALVFLFCTGGPIEFKTTVAEKEFVNAPVQLQMLMCDIDKFSRDTFNKPIVITRILGKVNGDSGVHMTYRAFDFRDKYLGDLTYTPGQSALLKDWINEKYKRLDGYKVALHHGKHLHFHIQIPAKSTDLRGPNYAE